mgnify:CR=1 FL=1
MHTGSVSTWGPPWAMAQYYRNASSAANGYIKLFEVPKDTTQWIIKRAQDEYDAVIQPQAASALASVTASDLRRADNELVKLVSYVNGESDITEEHVTLLTPYVADANVFEMVDALAAGNANRALSLMNTVLEQDTSEGAAIPTNFETRVGILRPFRDESL